MSTKKLNLTLVVCLVFVLTVSSFANADFVAARRTHRMAKKRSPDLGLVGIGNDPSTISATSQSSSTTSSAPVSVSSTSSSASSATSSSALTSASASSVSGSLNGLSLSLSLPSSSSSTSSSSSSSSTSTSTSSSTSTTSSSSITSTSDSPPQTTAPSLVTEVVSGEIVTLTSTAASEQTSAANQLSGAAQNNDDKTKSAALTTLIVVASCVGGVVILWTIFRKWKLARSSKFDQRLQPIDWQPTDAEDRDPAMLRRRASDSSSFHSGTSHAGYPGSGSDGYGAATLPPLPEHDFTAGPSHLAPVGGYADLARGPSPGPQMNELARGPSFTRPNYDIGVPIHNQAAYRY